MNALTQQQSDVTQVHLDDTALEQLMAKEDNNFTGTVGTVRVVSRNVADISQHKQAEGTLFGRMFSLLEATHWCKVQSEFQDTVLEHPAFILIRDELRTAHEEGTLNQKFDIIESTGAIVTFEKDRGLVTIGLNEPQMRAAIRERTRMVDLGNKRLIGHLNDPMTNESWKIFKEPSKDNIDNIEMSTSYYVSFAV
ncbi:hypothetical protein D3C73_209690 [compost metagenome]|jgi:hypothetical protein